MPVSNEHLSKTCRVWDGHTFFMLPIKEAAAKEKKGLVQRTANLTAGELKRPDEFASPEDEKKPKRRYKTRQMKAEP